jgi:hypothetical protein
VNNELFTQLPIPYIGSGLPLGTFLSNSRLSITFLFGSLWLGILWFFGLRFCVLWFFRLRSSNRASDCFCGCPSGGFCGCPSGGFCGCLSGCA